MSKKKWTDNDIENTLTQLPPVKDRRSKDELFRAIEKRTDERPPPRFSPKKKKPWLVPAMAAAAAVFILLLIVPPLFSDDHLLTTDDQAEQNSTTMDNAADYNDDANTENDMENTQENENADVNDDAADNEADVGSPENNTENNDNAGEVENDAADGNDEMAPSELPEYEAPEFVVYTARIQSENGSDYVVMEEEELDEELSGEERVLMSLQNSDPTSGGYLDELEEVTIENDTAVLHFSEYDALQSLAATEHEHLNSILEEVLTLYGFNEIQYMSGGEPGIMFGQEGDVETHDLSRDNRGYYLVDDEEGLFLISGKMAGEDVRRSDEDGLFTFEETVDKMKEADSGNGWYSSAIPDSVEIVSVHIPGDTAQVTYSVTDEAEYPEAEELEAFYQSLKLSAKFFTLESLEITNEETEETVQFDLAE